MFFPEDTENYRPSKILFRIDVLREMDRVVQGGVGGYETRHELVNDLVEQGLIGLRFPEGDERAESLSVTKADADGPGPRAAEPAETPTARVKTHIRTPERRGTAIENELAHVSEEPMFGMHNRDAPSLWALSRLAEEASSGPVLLADFYDSTTKAAWKLAAQLAPHEAPGGQKVAVMLPRNPAKPQSANDGFRAFALGTVARKPNADGLLAASGPFYQWGVVGITGDITRPEIGLTEAGWELLEALDGLAFSLPHGEGHLRSFLAFLRDHAPSDAWGFRTVLEGAQLNNGRQELNAHFEARLKQDFGGVEWRGSVAESVASGYVSRARAWGLIDPKLEDRAYKLTPLGESVADGWTGKGNSR